MEELNPGADDAPPAVRFANMLLLKMQQEELKELEIDSPDERQPVIRGRNARDEWNEITKPPERILRVTLNRLKVMANLDPIGSRETKKGEIRIRDKGSEHVYELEFDPKTAGGKSRIVLRS